MKYFTDYLVWSWDNQSQFKKGVMMADLMAHLCWSTLIYFELQSTSIDGLSKCGSRTKNLYTMNQGTKES